LISSEPQIKSSATATITASTENGDSGSNCYESPTDSRINNEDVETNYNSDINVLSLGGVGSQSHLYSHHHHHHHSQSHLINCNNNSLVNSNKILGGHGKKHSAQNMTVHPSPSLHVSHPHSHLLHHHHHALPEG
jgi:hypothetical protein